MHEDDAPDDSPLDLSGVSVLVVDDDDDSRYFAVFLLEIYGAQVAAVPSAAEALNFLAHNRPDVLLSDITMPDTDGYMLIQQVKALLGEKGEQLPAIAVTAHASKVYQQQAIAAGFQEYLTKPIEPDALVRAIISLVKLPQKTPDLDLGMHPNS